LNLAESEVGVAIVASRFDADPWLLNVENGTIDLRTGELHPHRREDLITKIAPVIYETDAECPRWTKFLEEVQPDPGLRAYLRRLAGYSATGVVRDHVLPIFYGSGRNGKGVYTNANQHVLGDYARIVPTEVLMAKQLDDHPTGRMVLFGCRLAIASETEQNRGLATALVKQLTGGDPITARLMRKDYVTFLPTHKLLLATNYRPVIKETKDAIWDRVHLVPWNQRFLLEKQDKQLGEKLKAEASGILRWMVEGCLEWQRIGLAPPETVVAATEQYRKDMDLLGDFFAECCVLDAGAQVSRPTLRRAYEQWAEEVGQKHTLDPKGFADVLRERGCIDVPSLRETGRPTPVRGWKGIRLRTDKDVDTYAGEDTDSGKHANTARHEASNPEGASTTDYVSTGAAAGGDDGGGRGTSRSGGTRKSKTSKAPRPRNGAGEVHHVHDAATDAPATEPPAATTPSVAPAENPTAEREVFEI
jgi:putative DNA primase/helicase